MKLHIASLRRYISSIPAASAELAHLLDDVGIEVKRIHTGSQGEVLTLELLANRGDHHCYVGIARELYGRLGKGFAPVRLESPACGDAPQKVEVTSPACLSYSLSMLSLNPAKVLPQELRTVLEVAETQTGHAAVDVTNYVNSELGQPLHAFDAGLIVGQITVRAAREGERAQPLFSDKDLEVPAGTTVIADEAGIIAIAGVIGCERAKVTPTTTTIALESALFDPVAVRIAARALKITTASSQRFERGGDPAMVLKGAWRAIELLSTYAQGKQIGKTIFIENHAFAPKTVKTSLLKINTYLTQNLTHMEVKERLGRYGFELRKDELQRAGDGLEFAVTVPSHRLWDIESPQCLYEELAKSIGYNAIPLALPPDCRGSVATPQELRRERIDQLLIGAGFYEVITDGFYGRSLAAKLGVKDSSPLGKHIESINSVDKNFSLLKNNALLQALELIENNWRNGLEQVKAFEWTTLFVPDATSFVCEKKILWLAVSGLREEKTWQNKAEAADIWYLKGLVLELGRSLGVEFSLREKLVAKEFESLLHPSRRFSILCAGKVIGSCGEVHPGLLGNFKIGKSAPMFCQIERDELPCPKVRRVSEDLLPEYRSIKRSMAFHVPSGVSTEALSAVMLAEAGEELLAKVEVKDFFASKGEDVRAFTYELSFRNDNKTSSETINRKLEAIAKAIADSFANAGVVQR